MLRLVKVGSEYGQALFRLLATVMAYSFWQTSSALLLFLFFCVCVCVCVSCYCIVVDDVNKQIGSMETPSPLVNNVH